MSDPSGTGSQGRTRQGGAPGDSWEHRAAGLASEIQRWLIKTSARSMRDELGDQVRKAFRGSDRAPGDSWATATTEPPHAAEEAPECAWCPVCRAARRLAQARAGTDSRGAPRLSDAADVMAGAVRDVLAGIDSVLSYKPGEGAASRPGGPPRSAESAATESAEAKPPAQGSPGAGSAGPGPTAAGPAAAGPAGAGPAGAESDGRGESNGG